MNKILRDYYPIFGLYQAMRPQLLDIISDADLAFSAGGDNPTLGELCRDIGETERAYIDSFSTFAFHIGEPTSDPEVMASVERLRAWYEQLDLELRGALERFSDHDIDHRIVDRGDFRLPLQIQLDVYKEALLIFYGKVSIVLKAMSRPLPKQWEEWIG